MKAMKRYLRESLIAMLTATLLAGCGKDTADTPAPEAPGNPFLAGLNEPTAYGDVTAEHVADYAGTVLERSQEQLAAIKAVTEPTFDNVVVPFDRLSGELSKCMSNAWMLYWEAGTGELRRRCHPQ